MTNISQTRFCILFLHNWVQLTVLEAPNYNLRHARWTSTKCSPTETNTPESHSISWVVSRLVNSYIFYLETLTAVRFSLLSPGSAINETTAQTFPINQDNSKQWFPALACMCYNVKRISLCLCLTCLTCRPWLHILSSRSHRLAMSVFSSRPVMFTSPCPSSTASLPIFSTNIRLVWTSIDKQH